MRPAVRGRLLLLGTAVTFGLMAVLARRLTRERAFTAGQLSVVRFAAGAAFSLLAFRLGLARYAPVDRRRLWSRGLSGGVVVVLYFLALARIPAGEAGMLYNLFPVLATALAVPLFGERPTVHLLLALLLATAGVALVLGGGSLSLGLGPGEALALGAAVFAAISAVTIRAMRATDNAATIFLYFCLGGLPVAIPFALDPWTLAPGPWALALLMALCAYAAQVMMAEAYGALTVPEAAIWLQLTPIAQVLLAVPLLGEVLPLASLLGVVVGVAGVAYGSVFGSRRRAPLIAALLLLPPLAQAREVAGVALSETVEVGGQPLLLNGAGLRKRLVFEVYVGALYLPARTDAAERILAADAPWRLTMTFRRDVDHDKIVESFRVAFLENSPGAPAGLVADLERLHPGLTDVKDGQVLALHYLPGAGTTLTPPTGGPITVPGRAFGEAMLRAWLGEHPADAALKAALLGR
jgi:drug/metabolite transporter (DMT)-like permease